MYVFRLERGIFIRRETFRIRARDIIVKNVNEKMHTVFLSLSLLLLILPVWRMGARTTSERKKVSRVLSNPKMYRKLEERASGEYTWRLCRDVEFLHAARVQNP